MRHATRPSRGRALLAEWPAVVVLAGAGSGLALASDHDVSVRVGMLVLACSLGIAGILRLVLPRARAGLLAVRGRVFDAAVLLGGGVLLAALVLATPPGQA